MAIFFSKNVKLLEHTEKKPNFKNYQNIDVVKCNLNQQKDILKLFNYTKKNFNWDTLLALLALVNQ